MKAPKWVVRHDRWGYYTGPHTPSSSTFTDWGSKARATRYFTRKRAEGLLQFVVGTYAPSSSLTIEHLDAPK